MHFTKAVRHSHHYVLFAAICFERDVRTVEPYLE
jgi:hypothetical protein